MRKSNKKVRLGLPTHKSLRRIARKTGQTYVEATASALDLYRAIVDAGAGTICDSNGDVIFDFEVTDD